MMLTSGGQTQLSPPDLSFDHDLAKWINQVAPASALAIGQRAVDRLSRLLPAGAQLETLDHRDALARVTGLGVFDLAVVTDTVEHLEKTAAEQLLGNLRDLHAHHLLLLVPIGEAGQGQQSSWAPGDLLALGMSRVGCYNSATARYYLYHFALETYKQAPDWLNSKYWAHPERYDIYEE